MSSSVEGFTATVRTFSDTPDTNEEGLPWSEADASATTNIVKNMEPEDMSNEENEEIEIHSGIPIPETARRRGRGPRYPLMKMDVGQSFFVECHRDEEGKREERTLRQTVSRYHRRLKDQGIRWVVSRQDDSTVGVWRKS